MKTRFHACLWVLILLLVQPVFSWASATFIPPVPADTGQTEIYLLTRGAGDEAYMKYGHTMIRVVDPSHNLDVAYNWGMFDFRTPGFIVKFLRGLLLYHLGIPPTRYEVGVSQSEHRWLVQERINLTDRQKAALLLELNREAQPDRRYLPLSVLHGQLFDAGRATSSTGPWAGRSPPASRGSQAAPRSGTRSWSTTPRPPSWRWART